jgi:hypothetical protein
MNRNKYILCCLVLLAGLSFNGYSQIINTIAGNGIAGFSGDGSMAVSAQLDHPKSTATDAAGNVYVADAYNNRIRKINPLGVISTFAGVAAGGFSGDGFAATVAQLDHPNYVAVDGAGNVYICDGDNQRIRKVNTSGIISTVAGIGSAGYSGDSGPATAAEINFPTAIALDGSGNLFIADQYNNCIRKVNTAGIISTYAGTGATGYSGEGGLATAADLGFPFGLAADASGNVYVGLYFDNRVVKINTAGIVTTVAGDGTAGFSGDGLAATLAQFDSPWGIAVDGVGNLYVADNGNYRIRKVNTSGIISTIAGNGTSIFSGDGSAATTAGLNNPIGVSVSAGGNIYIPEYSVHRVRMINGTLTYAPTFTGGHSQALSVCQNAAATPINSLLAIADLDAGQTETWAVMAGPLHGTLVAAFTTTSTGAAITPTGLTYMPTTGYSGLDSFKVSINDGTATDSTTVIVTITPLPLAGTITGTDSVCPGNTVTLANAVTGGTWSSSNTAISTVSSTGVVTGMATGVNTITYTVSNSCGSATTTRSFTVRSLASCPSGVMSLVNEEISVFPNPGNGMFTLTLPTSLHQDARIVITNAIGKKVKEMRVNPQSSAEIQLDEPAGVYFLNVTTAAGTWKKQIIVGTGKQ